MKTTYEFEAVHFVYHGVKTESLNHTAQLYGTILSHAGLTAVENENTLGLHGRWRDRAFSASSRFLIRHVQSASNLWISHSSR